MSGNDARLLHSTGVDDASQFEKAPETVEEFLEKYSEDIPKEALEKETKTKLSAQPAGKA
jgi:hypothetical protein